MKLGGRDGDSITSWDRATCFSCMKDGLQKFWGSALALIMLVRLCCKVCFSPCSIWVNNRENAHCWGRMCKKKYLGKSSGSALGMLADGQCTADTGDSVPLTLQRCQCLTHPLESANKMWGSLFPFYLTHEKTFVTRICRSGSNPGFEGICL